MMFYILCAFMTVMFIGVLIVVTAGIGVRFASLVASIVITAVVLGYDLGLRDVEHMIQAQANKRIVHTCDGEQVGDPINGGWYQCFTKEEQANQFAGHHDQALK